ncbi:hypothetical protein A4A49_04387 [Nicotiana attenuata]|uniref:Uncharacterized protein n=1 Tax=Nicotiana attenuata TaxID=49451 RepID=A0A314L3R3_NICAT|nr:hypothetical protein A4A49_04387 [Nicotiana attenuata]
MGTAQQRWGYSILSQNQLLAQYLVSGYYTSVSLFYFHLRMISLYIDLQVGKVLSVQSSICLFVNFHRRIHIYSIQQQGIPPESFTSRFFCLYLLNWDSWGPRHLQQIDANLFKHFHLKISRYWPHRFNHLDQVKLLLQLHNLEHLNCTSNQHLLEMLFSQLKRQQLDELSKIV